MEKITALIIDDEEPGRRNLRAMLERYCPEIEVIGEGASAMEGKEKILALSPGAIFLDIHMPELNGFDMLSSLNTIDFAIVFVTAHKDYGIQAVKSGATDYILKPIVVKELQQAVLKIVDYHGQKQATDTNRPERITLSHTKGFTIVDMKDIVRLEADNNYTRVYTIENKMYVVSKPLKAFEDSLHGDIFFRVHRSHIINLNHVRELLREDGGTLVLADESRILLPKSRYNEFVEAMKKLSISI
ncbi:MAG: LytTR family DNA-binding domain-containing protein [Chitinophagales bacterium]